MQKIHFSVDDKKKEDIYLIRNSDTKFKVAIYANVSEMHIIDSV